jgi:hypothetical protein
VTSIDVSRTEAHRVRYSTVEGITLWSGSVGGIGKSHVVHGTSSNCPVTFYPSIGSDTFAIDRTSPTGPVYINASLGRDVVSIETQFGSTANVVFPNSFTYAERLGRLSINPGGHVELAAGGSHVLAVDDFSISYDATLDLNDNDFVCYGSNVTGDVEALVRDARNGGLWNGTSGITSTAARNNPNHNTTLGVLSSDDYKRFHGDDAKFDNLPLDTPAVLVKYTYYGDANFSGTVDFDDYVQIDVGFNTHRTGWCNGDFNLNGSVNFDDYVLIDIAFNTQGSTLRSLVAATAEQPAASLFSRGDALTDLGL